MEIPPYPPDEHEEVQPPTQVVQHFENMHCYVASNGQLVFDKCACDAEHLLAAPTQVEQPLYTCRIYLKEMVPRQWLDKRGTLKFIRYASDDHIVLSLRFIPDEQQPKLATKSDPALVLAREES